MKVSAVAKGFSQKPLATAGGPKRRGLDLNMYFVLGGAVDARKALEDFKGDGKPPLVPSSGELVRRSKQGAERMLLRGVMAFDLGADGTVLYTTGSAAPAVLVDEPPAAWRRED